ncbi:MAG: pseudouridine synthase [Phycisphaerales bacterium]
MTDQSHPTNRPQSSKEADLRDATRGERLQRVMADAGIGSRRSCEALIEDGEVTVNGKIVTQLPAWVDPSIDRIVVQSKVLPQSERLLYVMLNKPPRTLSAVKDEPGYDRRTVTELVNHPAAARLFPVGRLDYETVGLILLTNDGELANRLTHPRYGVPKTYRVTVKGQLDEDAIQELERGIFLAQRKEGHTQGAKRTAHVEIRLIARDRDSTVMELTLREGRNRQVRRMLAAVGYPVRKLERIGMGPVRLKAVARGQWRELTRDEIKSLRKAAAMKLGDDQESGSNRAGNKPKVPYTDPRSGPSKGVRRRSIKNAINHASQTAPGKSKQTGGSQGKPASPSSRTKNNPAGNTTNRGPRTGPPKRRPPKNT